jgi:antitoxin ParD1/3/4
MNVTLPPELEDYVNKKIESGLYQTANEVIHEGLRLLRERDELHQTSLEELRRDIALGIEQADQGRVAPLNARETLARIRKARETQTQQDP